MVPKYLWTDLIAGTSENPANVLRRTLSTSRRVKRVGRGTYGVSR